MKEEATRTVEVFYSYAQKDQLLQKELEKHLAMLRRQGLITGWQDGEIIPGKVVKSEIADHLNKAQIILLLISPDFLASDFHYDQAVERHHAG